jgi:hypothetical protein
MSIIVTPTLNPTETFQVATPFSYSFTYPTAIQTSDAPVYYYGNYVISNDCNYGNTISFTSDLNPINVKGLTYTVSNMLAIGGGRELEGDVLECVLPILESSYSLDVGSYVTFGGPTVLNLEGGPTNGSNILGHYATFSGVGKFAYGLDDNTTDSLQYIPLVGTPVSSFKIKLTRPHNINATIDCTITANVMTVTRLYSQASGGGQVTVGMHYTSQGSPSRSFTVTSYITADANGVFGGADGATYGVTPTDGGGVVTGFTGSGISIDYVAGSGDVIFSNSMTPSYGSAQFLMYAPWTYAPAV